MSKLPPIIIKKKKIKKISHSHGGAWKIAYADFVTAMMAFFLMMWLVSSISEDQKQGIADYFAPNVVTMDFRQSGQAVLGGESALGKKSTRYDVKKDAPPAMQDRGEAHFSNEKGESQDQSANKITLHLVDKQGTNQDQQMTIQKEGSFVRTMTREEKEKTDRANLEKMEGPGGALTERQKSEQQKLKQVEKAVEDVLREHEEWRPHIKIEITREGLVLNLVELDKRPLFTTGSAALVKETQEILKALSKIIIHVDNKIIISGHTDAYNYTNEKLYSNWELSSDRANSARRYFVKQGVDKNRFKRIDGLEAKEPINADNIYASENRRVRITLARDHELSLDQLKELNGETSRTMVDSKS